MLKLKKLSQGNYRDTDKGVDICNGLEGYKPWVLFINDEFIADAKTKAELVKIAKESI